jgi:hypothetical protein
MTTTATAGKTDASKKEASVIKRLEIRPLDDRIAHALKIDQEIRKLVYGPDIGYVSRAEKFNELLQEFMEEALPESQKSSAILAASHLYRAFDKSHKNVEDYDRYIMWYERIENYAPNLALGAIDPEVRWTDVRSLQTLWNLTHQYLIRQRFPGSGAFNTLYGKDDEYAKLAIKAVMESIPQNNRLLIGYSVVVNEGEGRIIVNVRDPGQLGHAISAYLNYREKTVEVSCLMKDEDEIKMKKNILHAHNLTVNNNSRWLFIAGSTDQFEDILKVLYRPGRYA